MSTPKQQTLKRFPKAHSEDGGTMRYLTKERFGVYDGNGGMFRRCLGRGPTVRKAWEAAATAK